ncbi:MAG: hypothetical protein QOK34_1187, partial [Gaiellaceae bacterium]|nr:hypothetical protein [Gaiellaceae bacterium]
SQAGRAEGEGECEDDHGDQISGHDA